jgi:SAM-dependent methyltransferase
VTNQSPDDHSFDRYRDSYAARVEEVVSFSGRDLAFFTAAKIDVLERLARTAVGPPSDASILDVGCGPGEADGLLAQRFGSVTGVDVSEPLLEVASTRNPTVRYRASDGRDLPFADGTFDVAFASCVIHHVPPPDWEAFVREMARVTRPGGLVCLIEHNPLNPLTRFVVSRCEFDDDATLVWPRQALRLLRLANLDRHAREHFLLFPWSSRRWRAAERVASRLPLGAQYVAAGRKTA